jgi:hypothetical protein
MKTGTPMDSDVNKQENKTTEQPSELGDDDRAVFQPVWIRRCAVFFDPPNWGSLVRQFYYVLCGGIVFWACLLLSL